MNNNITVKEAIGKCDMLYWSTQKDRKNTLRNANVFLNFYGKNNLMNDVSTETIREFKYHLRINHKYSNDTINRKCAALSKLITYAKGCRGFIFNWGTPIVEYEKSNGRRKLIVTSEVENKLLSATKKLGYKEKVDLWVFLIEVGCRLSEALKLSWNDVSENFEYVHFSKTKNDEDRVVPIFGKVSNILRSRKERNLAKPFPFSISSVEWTWGKVRKYIGMSGEKEFVIHALRHTSITRMLRNKIGIEVAQLVVGHKDIRMTQSYNHPTKEELRSSMMAVKTIE